MRHLFERLLAGRLSLTVILLIFLALWGFLIGPIRSLSNNILVGGALSLLVLSAITFTFYMITLWLAGPHVLPINLRDGSAKKAARRVLRRYALGSDVLMAVVREGAVLPAASGERRDRASGEGVIDIDSTSGVALRTNIGLSRIKGTGIVFTRDTEKIGQIIDLRIQLRSQEFDFTTRDGIRIKVRVSIRFQIDQTHFRPHLHASDRNLPDPLPLVWSQHAVQRALNFQSVQADGTTIRWDDMPLGLAAGMLRGILAEFTFDGLTAPQDPMRNPRQEIRERLDQDVRAELALHGIRVLTVGLGAFFPFDFDQVKALDPNNADKLDSITEQRIRAWQAEWESRMIRMTAEAEAAADRRHDLASTQAQMELITQVTQALEQSAPVTLDNQDAIARRFLETLQNMAKEPDTHARLSEENLRQLRNLLGPTEQSEPDESSSQP